MSMEFIILRATVSGSIKTVLIDCEQFEGEPRDYFVGAPEDACEAGRVQALGDTDELDAYYTSE